MNPYDMLLYQASALSWLFDFHTSKLEAAAEINMNAVKNRLTPKKAFVNNQDFLDINDIKGRYASPSTCTKISVK